MKLETAFLSELRSEEIYQRLQGKVERKEKLNDEELMEFIILPLSYHERKEKEEKIQQTVNLAVQIQDREQQFFILAGILTFTDKLIDEETANKIRRALEMTKVAQMLVNEGDLKRAKKTALNMFKRGDSLREIAEILELPADMIESWKEEWLQKTL